MSFEIEIKAHINEDDVDNIVSKLKSLENCKYLGEIDKKDIYWSVKDSDSPIFRTRLEIDNDVSSILITSKPLKKKDYSVEYNVENEFVLNADQWDRVIDFCNGLNLVIIRKKYKKGFHFSLLFKDFTIHCEVLNVKYLGWFIESEIVTENEDSIDKDKAESTLFELLKVLNISQDSVEPKGYNKLLKEVGHEQG